MAARPRAGWRWSRGTLQRCGSMADTASRWSRPIATCGSPCETWDLLYHNEVIRVPKPWRVLETWISFEDPYIRLRTDRCVTGSGHVINGYHVVEHPDWLNTDAITRRLDIVLVKEYRHGAASVIT